MIKIQVLCIGKLKEKYWRDACDEYLKRLSRYARVDIEELPEVRLPTNASAVIEDRVKEEESQNLFKRIQKNATVVVLDPRGRLVSSNEMAADIGINNMSGKPLTFLIGGSLGLSENARKYADQVISFGNMTFPHQLARVMLLEQIYRGYKILKGEKYHK